MPDIATYIGIGAGILTAVSLIPQLVKILKDKRADAISYGMLFTLLAGLAGWVAYGIVKNDYPIIITNSFSFIINALITVFSIKYKK
jgi:MtN3 and saliva related transmembrane protein